MRGWGSSGFSDICSFCPSDDRSHDCCPSGDSLRASIFTEVSSRMGVSSIVDPLYVRSRVFCFVLFFTVSKILSLPLVLDSWVMIYLAADLFI